MRKIVLSAVIGAGALVGAMFVLVAAASVAEAAQCRKGGEWYDCTDRRLWRQKVNYVPGCTCAKLGKEVQFKRPSDGKMIKYFCSGNQTERGRKCR